VLRDYSDNYPRVFRLERIERDYHLHVAGMLQGRGKELNHTCCRIGISVAEEVCVLRDYADNYPLDMLQGRGKELND